MNYIIDDNKRNRTIRLLIINIFIILLLVILTITGVLAYKEAYATNTDSVKGSVLAQTFLKGEDIGPVLDYLKDGISGVIKVDNTNNSSITTEATMQLSTLSANLNNENFKYALLTSTDKDFTNCSSITTATYSDCDVVASGNFVDANTEEDFSLASGIGVPASSTLYYKLIIYIDGTKEDNSSLMGNELLGTWKVNDVTIYTMTLDNQGADNPGTPLIYESYNNKFYYDNNGSKMSSTKNGIELPTRDGYTFGGYYSNTNGQGTLYIDDRGYLVSGIEPTFTSNLTWHAKWTSSVYTINLDNQGANSTGTTQIYLKYGDSYCLDNTCTTKMTSSNNKITIPEKDFNTFGGYYTENNCNGVQYINKNGFITSNANSSNYTGNGTLYACWNSAIYNISLNNNNATSTGSSIVYEKYNEGVYLDENATQHMTDNSNPITKPTKEYTVTLDYNYDGSTNGSATATYNFAGYYIDDNGSGDALIDSNGFITDDFINTYFDSDDTLYAKWVGGTISSLPSLTREGYTFSGWYTDDISGTEVTSNTVFTENKTIYAHWMADSVTKFVSGNMHETRSLEEFNSTLTKNSNTSYTIVTSDAIGGGFFDDDLFEAGKNYIISFKIRKTAGTLKNIGGHSLSATQSSFKIDGNDSSGTYYDPGTNMSAMNDGQEHLVEFEFEYSPGTDINNLIYIQPNRGYTDSVTVNITDLMLFEVVDTRTGSYGQAYGTLPTPSRVGYTFNGWYTEIVNGNQVTESSTIPANDVTYYARWECPVTFDNNYLSGDFAINSSHATMDGNYYRFGASDVTLISNNILGSSAYVAGAKGANVISASMAATGNAGRGPYYYYANFYGHTSGLTVGNTYTWSVYVKSSSNKTMRIGLEQGGLKEVEVGTNWKKVTHTFVATDNVSKSFILYSTTAWNSGDYLYFHSLEIAEGDGSSDKTIVNKNHGEILGNLPVPTRLGYTFSGWYTQPNSGSQISENTIVPYEAPTYYAMWDANTYTITYNLNGGSGVPSTQTFVYNRGDKINSTIPTRSGYTFTGYKDPNNVIRQPGDFVPWTYGNFTLTAQWAKNYTLTYKNNGGSGCTSKSVAQGTKYGTLCTPSHTSYTFNNWYTSSSGGSQVTSNTIMGASNATIYAHWKQYINGYRCSNGQKYYITYCDTNTSNINQEYCYYANGSVIRNSLAPESSCDNPSVSFGYTSGYVCPSDGDSTSSTVAQRNIDCHKGLYYNRMLVSNASYSTATGNLTFDVTLYMNSFAISGETGGNATVCVARVGTNTCLSELYTYSFVGSWLGVGQSMSLGTFTVNVSNYSAGDYKVIARPNYGNKFSFSNSYTNVKFFTVSR